MVGKVIPGKCLRATRFKVSQCLTKSSCFLLQLSFLTPCFPSPLFDSHTFPSHSVMLVSNRYLHCTTSAFANPVTKYNKSLFIWLLCPALLLCLCYHYSIRKLGYDTWAVSLQNNKRSLSQISFQQFIAHALLLPWNTCFYCFVSFQPVGQTICDCCQFSSCPSPSTLEVILISVLICDSHAFITCLSSCWQSASIS